MRFQADVLQGTLARVFVAMGVDAALAPSVAEAYVSADLSGHASHGVMRIPRIVAGIDAGTQHPANRPVVVRDGPSFALLDGNSALGVAVGIEAMRLAIAKARETGMACVGVFNSNHFGAAGFYVRIAALERMIGFTFCNGAPGIAAFGGTRAVLGTNPIAIGAPTRGDPLILDLSVSALVRGKALEHQRRGERLSPGLAVDASGRPTTDPTEALAGAFLPYGGDQAYKTFGLALMIDVLCGPLVGAAFGDRVAGSADTTVDCTKGDVYIALDIARFRDYESYLDDVGELAATVKASGEAVKLPGEVEHDRVRASKDVVELDDDMAQQIRDIVRRYTGSEFASGI